MLLRRCYHHSPQHLVNFACECNGEFTDMISQETGQSQIHQSTQTTKNNEKTLFSYYFQFSRTYSMIKSDTYTVCAAQQWIHDLVNKIYSKIFESFRRSSTRPDLGCWTEKVNIMQKLNNIARLQIDRFSSVPLKSVLLRHGKQTWGSKKFHFYNIAR